MFSQLNPTHTQYSNCTDSDVSAILHMCNVRGVIKKFSAWPSSVQNKIKTVNLLLIVARPRTGHAQYDFWAFINFCWVGIVWKVLQKIVHSLVLAFSTPIWLTLRSYAKMHKIFITRKSYCACHVLSLATLRIKYYFNFILDRTRSGRELSDRPS